MRFDYPVYFYLLLLLPVLYALLYAYKKWAVNSLHQLTSANMRPRVLPNFSLVRHTAYFWALLVTIYLLIMVLADPKAGEETKKIRKEGIDVVMCLDLSNSMNAEDIAPSRLEKAKNVMRQTLKNLTGERVGLVVYAGDAYGLLPLTGDYAAIDNYISQIEPQMMEVQGTNIAAAINEASNMLKDVANTSKAIILLSDGEDHEGGLDEAIDKAKQFRIQINTIGIGTARGATIPQYNNGLRNGIKTTASGEPVITRLDANNLKELAKRTKGTYSSNGSTAAMAQQLGAQFATDSHKGTQHAYITDSKHIYQIFLALALLALSISIAWELNPEFLSRFIKEKPQVETPESKIER